jgi:hypothetical protein
MANDKEIKLWQEFITTKVDDKIEEYINSELNATIDRYSKYYSNNDVLSKFRNKNNSSILIENLKKIKVISYFTPQGNSADRAWGYIYTNNLYTVFLNVYNFFNGRLNASITDTIIHEIGHLIDFQLRRLGEIPSYMENSIINPSINDEYTISREEDYARVQRLRFTLELSPLATIEELKQKLSNLVTSNRIQIDELKIDFIDQYMVLSYIKPIRNLTLSELSSVLGQTVIDNYLASDIGYLFAKYSFVKEGKIYIDLDKISKINKLFVNNDDDGFSDIDLDNFV